MTRREETAAATRADILFAARKLFATHGYETVTIRQIAKFTGRSTGALFAHWPGKDELFAEAMGRPHFTDAMGARLWLRVASEIGGLGSEAMQQALLIAQGWTAEQAGGMKLGADPVVRTAVAP